MRNNPINNAARVAARAAEAKAFLKVHGEGIVMEDPQVLAEKQRIVAIPLIRNLLEQRTPLYFGITGCADVKDEDLRWLTARGLMKSDGTFSGAKNRPVLVWKDGRQITMKEGRDKLEFKTEIVFKDLMYYNAAQVEASLQRYFKEDQGLTLGQHLWRVSGAGGSGLYKKWDSNKEKYGKKVIKVFVVYSEKAKELIASGAVKVVK